MSQDVLNIFRYNDVEYRFDMRDADDAEKYERAIKKLEATEGNLPKDGKTSTAIRGQCTMLKDFFDNLFGDGAGAEICGSGSNLADHLEAYEAFMRLISSQTNYINNKTNTFRQYSNRAQRRHPQNPGQNKGKHGGAPYAVK